MALGMIDTLKRFEQNAARNAQEAILKFADKYHLVHTLIAVALNHASSLWSV